MTVESDPHASEIVGMASVENSANECEFYSLGANGSLIQWTKFFKNTEIGEVKFRPLKYILNPKFLSSNYFLAMGQKANHKHWGR